MPNDEFRMMNGGRTGTGDWVLGSRDNPVCANRATMPRGMYEHRATVWFALTGQPLAMDSARPLFGNNMPLPVSIVTA